MLPQYTPWRDVGAINIQFHPLNSTEHGNEWSASHPSCFNPTEDGWASDLVWMFRRKNKSLSSDSNPTLDSLVCSLVTILSTRHIRYSSMPLILNLSFSLNTTQSRQFTHNCYTFHETTNTKLNQAFKWTSSSNWTVKTELTVNKFQFKQSYLQYYLMSHPRNH